MQVCPLNILVASKWRLSSTLGVPTPLDLTLPIFLITQFYMAAIYRHSKYFEEFSFEESFESCTPALNRNLDTPWHGALTVSSETTPAFAVRHQNLFEAASSSSSSTAAHPLPRTNMAKKRSAGPEADALISQERPAKKQQTEEFWQAHFNKGLFDHPEVSGHTKIYAESAP